MDPQNPGTDRTADLTRFMRRQGELATALLAILKNESLSPAIRAPAIAAASYSIRVDDLIPDDSPLYGTVDDLFIKAIAIEQLIPVLRTIGIPMKTASKEYGGTLDGCVAAMRATFPEFWEYCAKASRPLVDAALQLNFEDPQELRRLGPTFEDWAEHARARAASPPAFPEGSVERFMARFRSGGGGGGDDEPTRT